MHKAKIIDPAVGSASFLVGMMNVLVEILKNLYLRVEKKERNLFELKHQVISENLYGVDVKDWAVMMGELRLWRSLIIETDEKYMNIYNKPLLPSFTFKIRQGDSLVEEIAGKQLSLRGEFKHIAEHIKNRIEEIKSRKAEYFSSARHEWEKEIEDAEHELLKAILSEDIKRIDERIKAGKRDIESAPKKQIHILREEVEDDEAYLHRTRHQPCPSYT